MKPRFLLHCNMWQSTFTLAREGESWRRQFSDLLEAMSFASRSISEATTIVFYNDQGLTVSESTVTPRHEKA